MTIQIGDAAFETAKPDDLDEQLLAQTGCNAVEARRWLNGNPGTGHVAMALRPWLTGDNLPTMAELGELIADHGTADVARQLAELYDPPPEPEAQPVTEAPAEPAAEPQPDEEPEA